MPGAPSAAKARPSVVGAVLKRHRVRRLDADQVLGFLQQPALVLAPGTVAAACAHLELLLDRIRVVNDQLRRCRKELRQRVHGLATTQDPEPKGEQRDVTILLSMPGIGSTVLATLLAEAGRLVRERDYHGLRAFSGVALSAPTTSWAVRPP